MNEMKKYTGFTDSKNKKLYIGNSVRVADNGGRFIHGQFSGSGYRGIIEDNGNKDDNFRIVRYGGGLKYDSSLAWECSEYRKEFISKI